MLDFFPQSMLEAYCCSEPIFRERFSINARPDFSAPFLIVGISLEYLSIAFRRLSSSSLLLEAVEDFFKSKLSLLKKNLFQQFVIGEDFGVYIHLYAIKKICKFFLRTVAIHRIIFVFHL
jgi:hypothetical protein